MFDLYEVPPPPLLRLHFVATVQLACPPTHGSLPGGYEPSRGDNRSFHAETDRAYHCSPAGIH